ncbi:alpha/beta hydrolase [Endozoicomonas sp. YOMI1]|uniref:alpha/beta hydrolase n=1 Tax=Endozoicomonas sp. YOMI1 TaxID=2828739 RepID=UPI002148E056|nr:alpha/beta hydrolase [Endozoicomonas sp. YOMI1]
MNYGTIADRYTYESPVLRNRAKDAPSTNDQKPHMGIRSTKSVEPDSYLSRAKDLICSVPGTCYSILSRSAVVLTPFHWMVENRLGVAKFVGIPLVLSQVFPWLGKNYPDKFPFLRQFPNLQESREIVNAACEKANTNGFRTEYLTIKQDSGILHGVICYPPDWDPNNSHCILYNNPNGMVLSQLLVRGYLNPGSAPGRIQSEKKCPVILYDYRGTGLNQSDGLSGYLPFSTYETVVQDGVAALGYALENFERVYVAGTSLGGGVATAALARRLEASGGQDDSRVELLSHDSFTTTSRVVIPDRPRLADFLGWLVGGNLDAEAPMRKLIDRKINIVSLNHRDDPVIPRGARMSELIESLDHGEREAGRVFAKEFSGDSHAVLTSEMAQYL